MDEPSTLAPHGAGHGYNPATNNLLYGRLVKAYLSYNNFVSA